MTGRSGQTQNFIAHMTLQIQSQWVKSRLAALAGSSHLCLQASYASLYDCMQLLLHVPGHGQFAVPEQNCSMCQQLTYELLMKPVM